MSPRTSFKHFQSSSSHSMPLCKKKSTSSKIFICFWQSCVYILDLVASRINANSQVFRIIYIFSLLLLAPSRLRLSINDSRVRFYWLLKRNWSKERKHKFCMFASLFFCPFSAHSSLLRAPVFTSLDWKIIGNHVGSRRRKSAWWTHDFADEIWEILFWCAVHENSPSIIKSCEVFFLLKRQRREMEQFKARNSAHFPHNFRDN